MSVEGLLLLILMALMCVFLLAVVVLLLALMVYVDRKTTRKRISRVQSSKISKTNSNQARKVTFKASTKKKRVKQNKVMASIPIVAQARTDAKKVGDKKMDSKEKDYDEKKTHEELNTGYEPIYPEEEKHEDTIATADGEIESADVDTIVDDIENNNPLGGKLGARVAQLRSKRKSEKASKEAIKRQREYELYDEILDGDDFGDEMPATIQGKMAYWWQNSQGFRIASVIMVFVAVVGVFGFGLSIRNAQMRSLDNGNGETPPTQVAVNDEPETTTEPVVEENIIEKEVEKVEDVKESESPIDLDELSKILASERKKAEEAKKESEEEVKEETEPLEAEPVVAEGIPPLAGFAEAMDNAREEVGEVQQSYEGSNTVTLPRNAVGKLSIPSINLSNAPVMPTVELSDLRVGTGHFEETPLLDGNVGIAGHNTTHFKHLVNVNIGDTIDYTANGVLRQYEIIDVRAIADDDWSIFADTSGENRLTLITCERNVGDRRLAVIATQIGADTPSGDGDSIQASGGASTSPGYIQKRTEMGQTISQDTYHDVGHANYIGTFTGQN